MFILWSMSLRKIHFHCPLSLIINITHLKNSNEILQSLQILVFGTFQKCFDLFGELLPLLLLLVVPPLAAPGCWPPPPPGPPARRLVQRVKQLGVPLHCAPSVECTLYTCQQNYVVIFNNSQRGSSLPLLVCTELYWRWTFGWVTIQIVCRCFLQILYENVTVHWYQNY